MFNCTNPYCGGDVDGKNELCFDCASRQDRCAVCGFYDDEHAMDCGSQYTPSPMADASLDMCTKVDALNTLMDKIETMSVGQFMQLPMAVQIAYSTAQKYTKANGYNVDR